MAVSTPPAPQPGAGPQARAAPPAPDPPSAATTSSDEDPMLSLHDVSRCGALGAALFTALFTAATLGACGGDGGDTPAGDTMTTGDTATTDDIATSDDTATADDAATTDDTATAHDAADTVAPVTYTLSTGAVDATSVCGGAEATVAFTFSEPPPGPVTVRAALSDRFGDFGPSPVIIGEGQFSASGSIPITFPRALSGDGFRVRVQAPGVVAADDNGADIAIAAAPEIDVFFRKSLGTTASTYGVFNDTVADSFSWDLGPDASPQMATGADPTWSYATPGVKSVTLTATNDTTGCSTTETFPNANRVLGCAEPIPSGANVVRDGDRLPQGLDQWLCPGADVADGGGRKLVFVEPFARFEYTGGGTYATVVRAGGTYIATENRGALVYETGALIVGLGAVSDAIECPTLDLDLTDAPANGCVDPAAPPVAVTLDAVSAGPHCPGGEVDVEFSTDVAPAADNRFVVQLSGPDGDYTDGQVLGSVTSSATSGVLTVTLPSDAEGAYTLRVIATNPPSASNDVALDVPTLAAVDFSRDVGAPFIDETVAFTDTTVGDVTDRSWDFGEGATPATSTAANPTVSWSTPGTRAVTLSATDSSGCPVARTKSVTVIGCEVTVPADAGRVTGTESLTSATGHRVVCGGGSARLTNPNGATFYVLEGGQLEIVFSSGSSLNYVDAGAAVEGTSFPGGDGHVVVFESDTIRSRLGNVQTRSCDDVVIDTSAMNNPCPPFTPTPSEVALGEPDATDLCPRQEISVPFTQQGLFGGNNTFTLQLSDASGGFDDPVVLSGGPVDGEFTAQIPNDTPPGAGYKLRVVASNPPLTAESAATLTVNAQPTASFTRTGPQHLLVGATTTFNDTSTGDPVAWLWDFRDGGAPATSTEQDPGPVSWTVPGDKPVRLTVTNAVGCSHSRTLNGFNEPIRVFSCTPSIPGGAQVITGEASGGGGGQSIWVCDGGNYSAGGGSYTIYVEPGGTYTRTSGGSYTVYVPAGATYVPNSGGGTVLIRDPDAIINGSTASHSVLTCEGLAFDTSDAPSPGCE